MVGGKSYVWEFWEDGQDGGQQKRISSVLVDLEVGLLQHVGSRANCTSFPYTQTN